MERKNLRQTLWNVIGPIDLSAELVKKLARSNSPVSADFHSLLNGLKNPAAQKNLFLHSDKNLLSRFAEKYLNIIIEDETCVPLHGYIFTLMDSLSEPKREHDALKEAEHEMLCYLVQIYLNDETRAIFKRFLTVVFLFPDRVKDFKLLDSILSYYNIYNKKL